MSCSKQLAGDEPKKKSKYQFTPFLVGQVYAHMHHELTALQISRIILKGDGKSRFGEKAVKACMDALDSDPSWNGERRKGSGAPRKTTKRQDKQIVDAIYKFRGRAKVTVAWLQKRYVWARELGNTAVEERLDDAGLSYLRRRNKSLVEATYIPERLDYCEMVKRMHQATLDLWAYTDGTVFYLDRTVEEHEHARRAALGTMVWRQTDGGDALYADCAGPSCYAKGQGQPIRVWGVLAEGKLNIVVLDRGDVMNTDLFCDLVDTKFSGWLGGCVHLVEDFERSIRSDGAVAAFDRVGVKLVPGYPRCSQDFNAIENVWHLLRVRLAETMPVAREMRDEFIVRLHSAVVFINRYRKNRIEELSRNQKVRCRECVELKGARTSW